jgi:hypothetical protein
MHAVTEASSLNAVLDVLCACCPGAKRESLKPWVHHELVYAPKDAKVADQSNGASMRAWTTSLVPSVEQPQQWFLQQLGRPQDPNQTSTLVQQRKEVHIGNNYEQLLSYIGYTFDYEFIQKGYMFHDETSYPFPVEYVVYQLYALSRPGDMSSLMKINALRRKYFVEIRTAATNKSLRVVDKQLAEVARKFAPHINFHQVVPRPE